ncbi:Dihydrolipoyl dehydrogenase [Rubrobacter xylanophilus DSM 9941]|uniref:dihydrolipoyl dehydrogenase family protein n=1 Tax=Rubrobacter xylanophilus TaxID=49319 RepID=UPI001C63C6FD|nr:NAD(P)/FAD-dependent oxidoreductase [Rubrobacter xylanophilus]QYJ15041.1 Dihydrolipoyl dehydrogenase [Rubrobacter xylanophilus DSM 9941]
MADGYDVVVIGMGPGGEVAASRLISAGKEVAVVERELIGGECAYWACIPSKTLLRPPEVKNEAQRAFGTGVPELEMEAIFDYRDYMIRNLDDAAQVEGYERQGARVFKGEGRIAGPGRVEVDGETVEAGHIILATGSAPNVPPIEGLDEVTVWTNREVTTSREVPGRALIVGGGPNGIEAAQWLTRFGSEVTIVQSADRLIDREDQRVGELVRGVLEEEGVRVFTGLKAIRARRNGEAATIELDDGTQVEADVVVVAAGRTPRTEGLGLENVGIEPDGGAIPVDERCRAAEGVWAIGDVTGVALFTHVAKYQGRVAADNILGRERRADYRGIPRVVFSDPEIAACGLTEEQARAQGIDAAVATVDLAKVLARPYTYEKDPRGTLSLVADRERGVLVGAWAVAPLAGEWIHASALAIRAEVPIEKLLDSVAQFPTYSEAYLYCLERLDL